MVRKKQVNNENGAVLNRDFPRRGRSLIIRADDLRRLFPNVKPEYIDLVIKRIGDYRFGDEESDIELFGKILIAVIIQGALGTKELDEALKQYTELKEQAAGMDAAELMDARLAVRDEKERSAVDRVKSAYGEKYDPMMMHDSKRDVANLLHEEAETRSVREFLRQKQKAQQTQQHKKPKRHEQER